MDLSDILHRMKNSEPWSEGEKIFWNEPGYSRRMLQEHLSQDHDASDRRFEIIDKHAAWIHTHVLEGCASTILDLGCGTGLYTERLAQLGHTCVGLDFAPASIEYAQEHAQQNALRCTYKQQDIRKGNYKSHNAGAGYDLIMLIFGEFNAFMPDDAQHILREVFISLVPGGKLLLEPHTFFAVEREGRSPSSWYRSEAGLFSGKPHLCLTESFWDTARETATTRYFVVDAATGEVTRHAASMQAYKEETYQALLSNCGFASSTFYPSLSGELAQDPYGLFTILAHKPKT